jgi:hypothetical protein
MVTVLVDLGAVPVEQAVALVLAQDPAPPPGRGEEFGKASPVGLVVILLLGVATILLIRSMTKRLRRLPSSFGPPPDPTAGDPTAPTADGATTRTTDADTTPER